MEPYQTHNYYERLNLHTTATAEQIKAAYIRAAKAHHPDRNHRDPRLAHENFVSIGQAYEVLSDPAKKAQYDTAQATNRHASGNGESKPKTEHGTAKNRPRTTTRPSQEEPKRNRYSSKHNPLFAHYQKLFDFIMAEEQRMDNTTDKLQRLLAQLDEKMIESESMYADLEDIINQW
ncbi:MAG: J domain-containing protein [Candidatus Woesearchaeota archaeon]